MMTALLILIPLCGALLVTPLKGQAAKYTALLVTLVQLALTGVVLCQFVPNAELQFVTHLPWIKSLGISFHVGIDGISILLVLLTNLLLPLILLVTQRNAHIQKASFYALALLMQSALVGVFTAQDAFLYYIFWELALIPIFFIVLIWGQKNNSRITLKFFIYTLLGSLFMLAGLILVYLNTPDHSFSLASFYKANLSAQDQHIVFWLFFVAYAIKIPIFPFHTWQPSTYTAAPAAGTMLLSGIMLKMGLYSILRWILPIVPNAVYYWSDLVIILCLVGVIYGAWIAVNQENLKTLFAYSSLSHVGLIAAGIFTLNSQGLQGSLFQMLAHGINVVGMFFAAEIIQQQTQTLNIRDLGGIRQKAPVFTSFFLVIVFGSVALPLTNGFIGEFLLLLGVFEYRNWMAVLAGFTIIIGAIYMLKMFQRTMLGESNGFTAGFTDVTWKDRAVLLPVAALIILTGIIPMPLLKLTEASVTRLLELVAQNSIN